MWRLTGAITAESAAALAVAPVRNNFAPKNLSDPEAQKQFNQEKFQVFTKTT